MSDSIIIPSDFFTKFSEVIYYDEPHKYYLGKQELISVTTLIHKYQKEFNTQYWSDYKADEFDIPQENVIEAWNFINRKGTMKGSIIHDYAENLLLNKIFRYPKNEIINEFGFDPISKEYEITKKHIDRFIKHSKERLIPIRTEMIVYDKESLIGGMADIVFYNVKAKEFQIWDYKTNKEFTEENPKEYLMGELCTLEDCDLEIYSLQLEMYKQIIQRNTNIKLGQSYLIWVSHRNDDYKIIPTKNREYFANLLIQERIEEIRT